MCILAIIWFKRPDGNYEPIISILASLLSLLALVVPAYLIRKKHKMNDINKNQIHLIKNLLDRKESSFLRAREKWDTGVNFKLREGNEIVHSFYKDVWLQLASMFPSGNFGNMSNEEYLESFIKERYDHHYAEADSKGLGEGALAFIIVTGDVNDDLDSKIIELVSDLSSSCNDINLATWVKNWKLAE
ncbi:hypothetical protein C0W66_19890 [Photobacterium kishitanii]|nr:hypothetical protein AYY23_22515 [Photobacterium kishitanii]PSW47156.1 hypothetical protein C0W66_19890 [Photobacterium kishitanii]